MKGKRIMCGALALMLLCGCGKDVATESVTHNDGTSVETVAAENTFVPSEVYSCGSSATAKNGTALTPVMVSEKKWETTIEVKEFTRDGFKIYGELFRPVGEGLFPGIIIAHGYNANSDYAKGLAQMYAENGIVAYIFDFVGGGMDIKSDGEMTDMTVVTEIADFNTVFDGIRSLDFVDSSRMFVMGESMGGFVATYVAGTRPNDVKGLIALYPAYVLQEPSMRMLFSFLQVPDSTTFLGLTVNRKFYLDLLSFDIYKVMTNYTGQALIIHGTADSVVPISCSEKAAKLMANATLIPVPNAEHGFGGTDLVCAESLTLIRKLSNN
ncbi:MAG: lysophospholipase [Butyrivibrio sp.]|nr:lysophospholipase [Butyrivibrio sp.]